MDDVIIDDEKIVCPHCGAAFGYGDRRWFNDSVNRCPDCGARFHLIIERVEYKIFTTSKER